MTGTPIEIKNTETHFIIFSGDNVLYNVNKAAILEWGIDEDSILPYLLQDDTKLLFRLLKQWAREGKIYPL